MVELGSTDGGFKCEPLVYSGHSGVWTLIYSVAPVKCALGGCLQAQDLTCDSPGRFQVGWLGYHHKGLALTGRGWEITLKQLLHGLKGEHPSCSRYELDSCLSPVSFPLGPGQPLDLFVMLPLCNIPVTGAQYRCV